MTEFSIEKQLEYQTSDTEKTILELLSCAWFGLVSWGIMQSFSTDITSNQLISGELELNQVN